MRSFSTSIDISADSERVWSTLIDTGRWTSWDSTLEHVDGALAPGERLTIRVRGTKRPFRLTVRRLERGRHVTVSGGMPLGLFTGTRTYDIAPVDGVTRFTMAERYTGPMARLIVRSIPDLQPSFDAFAAGLRAASESAPSAR